jgi:regulator of RNase E activity RraB
MAGKRSVGDDWDFYPCRVDDARASIYLNLRYEKNAPLASADTLYWLEIQMLDTAEHGMGSSAEAGVLYPVEDQLTDRAQASGFLYVGRLRTDGCWRLAFYGPSGRLDVLQTLSRSLEGLDGREVETGSKPDHNWHYYRDFLLPDAERHQWMQDRRVVEALQEEGDPLRVPRRVDHWAHFPTADARNAFACDVADEGFVVEQMIDDSKGDLTFGARVHRVDPVELEHIHEVVMRLVELAEQQEGDYDGWETSVEKAPN